MPHTPLISHRTLAGWLALTVLAIAAACTSNDGTVTPTATPAPEVTPTSTATPAPTATAVATLEAREPTIAPDGRTGITELDALIGVILTADAQTLGSIYDGPGDRYCSDLTGNGEQRDVPEEEWPGLLASGERSLYAVARSHPQAAARPEYDVVLSVVTDGDVEAWSFGLRQGAVVGLQVGCGTPPRNFLPDVAFNYQDYVVLPPAEHLPQGPLAHPLNRRTDVAEVNTVLDVIESGDEGALLALVDYWRVECSHTPGATFGCRTAEHEGDTIQVLPQRACSNEQFFRRSDFVATRLPAAIAPGTTLHAVAVVPEAFRPVPADYSIILVNPGPNPYAWETRALYVRDGRIVAWDIGCSEVPAQLYPPFAYLVTPGGAYDRDSGIPAIDAALAAFEAQDVTALASAIDWTIEGCLEPGVNLGIGQPPHCEGDEQPGDLIETFSFGSCEGWSARRAEAIEALAQLLGESWNVYAIADRGPSALDDKTRYQVVLSPAASDRDEPAGLSLSFTERGLGWVGYGCGPTAPQWLLGNGSTPDFLLPPLAAN